MPNTIAIDGTPVGDDHPCFLVAEAGTTCNGDLTTAKELVAAAAEGGFAAIKFQTIWPEQLSDKSKVYRYETLHGPVEENMFDMFKGLVFSFDQWHELAACARSKNLIFFSTVDYLDGVDMMEACRVPLHKMGSWDITYEPLVIKIAKTGKPVMLDLGPAYLQDIVNFIGLYNAHGNGQVILLHDFHTDNPSEMNMRSIRYLKQTIRLPVGFSSPGRNADLDLMALALGANVIEKRISLSRSSAGHHHILCLEPHEYKPWADRLRWAESALGKAKIIPSPADLSDAKEYYRSICTTRLISKGERFSMNNLDGKRPGTGIPTRFLSIILGRHAVRDLETDTLLTWNDI